MLRLVHPAREGQATRPPRHPKTVMSLTDPERRALRIALKNLRRAFGSWSCLAEVLGVSAASVEAVANGHDRGSPGLALRAARASGVPIERILSGKLAAADRCPTCGHAAERRAS